MHSKLLVHTASSAPRPAKRSLPEEPAG